MAVGDCSMLTARNLTDCSVRKDGSPRFPTLQSGKLHKTVAKVKENYPAPKGSSLWTKERVAKAIYPERAYAGRYLLDGTCVACFSPLTECIVASLIVALSSYSFESLVNQREVRMGLSGLSKRNPRNTWCHGKWFVSGLQKQ